VPRVSDVVAGETEEGNLSFFNKAVGKVTNKTRTQDRTCDFRSTTTDFQSLGLISVFSPSYLAAGYHQQGQQVGERW